MLDLDRLRFEYDEWRRRERLRDSEARWQAFIAGAKSRIPAEFEELDSLTQNERDFVLSTFRNSIEVLKNPPKGMP